MQSLINVYNYNPTVYRDWMAEVNSERTDYNDIVTHDSRGLLTGIGYWVRRRPLYTQEAIYIEVYGFHLVP